MSTDLQLHHELPKLRISNAKVIHSNHVKAKNDDDSSNNDDDDDGYLTPTSKESKIPTIIECPPAPRKAKQVSCKRKLMDEYRFFEVENKEEMDAFFMSNFPKKSCHFT
ncbi:hypothetical protein TanjilG_19429 [Lupinus angustifolius]|uniref:Uncharacterized protein n=1 Tax=Lupinus angustifolius TaxID=3871 RepID=A0A4P1R5E1_LUPAN|nr:PREDICTED: cyclin-dependent protein kinase inhibitor SMR1-like [Lupinus angustifolius]OIW01503.1 hypothetical protein TanjilG_19429 [Lupinus angustifolius]